MPKQTIVKQTKISQVIELASGYSLSLSKPLVMAVFNATPDSFSDGGKYNSLESACKRVLEMVSDGADIIDIGGESSRPGAEPISIDTEIKRVVPLITELRKHSNIPISIDTCKYDVAKEAVHAGADILNDITSLRFSDNMADFVAEKNIPVILMHMQGNPKTMQENPVYTSVTNDIVSFFEERINYAEAHGIDRTKIILDPGIGFGKKLTDNLEILSNIALFKKLNHPILIGTSRKSFINQIHPTDKNANARIGGSLASAISAVMQGAHIVRVHDVYETVEAVKVLEALGEIQ